MATSDDFLSTPRIPSGYDKRKYITFPEVEYEDIQEQLKATGEIKTTRVSKEAERYTKGEVYNSHFGPLKCTGKKMYKSIDTRADQDEITEEQFEALAGYTPVAYYTFIVEPDYIPVKKNRLL